MLWLAAILASASGLLAQQSIALIDDRDLSELSGLSLEQLMQLQVTSVAGVGQDWFTTPAAVYVITQDEARRSGHQNLAEALRLAPGVFVGQSGGNRWQIGTRGFNGALANKTLVLIDGREVYDPLFGGTFWDAQDVLMEDLDRIEVIRGPGPTLWGANAVNGVFNVVTRSARDTQGLYLTALAGTYQQGMGAVRYGGQIDDDTWFRLWGKYANFDNLDDVMGRDNADDWDVARGGFRLDREGPDGAALTIDAGIYSTHPGETLVAPVRGQHLGFDILRVDGRAEGGHLLARLGREDPESRSGWSLQAYYDRSERVIYGGFDVTRDSFDIDFRNHFTLGDAQQIVWGLGARYTHDGSDRGPMHELDPSSRDLSVFSAFVQDTFTLVPEKLFLMIGTKLEHNDYTGFEVQPSGRLWWTPDEDNTLWASVSRAIRTPSRLEREGITAFAYVDAGGGNFVPLGVTGNDDAQSEIVLAYETGYRRRITDSFTADLTLFYNDYDRLLFLPSAILGEFTAGEAETYGGELSLTWHVAENWRLQAAYSYVDVHIHGNLFPQDEGNTPEHMAQIRSYLDITDRIELNAAMYFVDNVRGHQNPSYIRLDVGVTWRPTDYLEISAWGLNLTDPSHPEFTDPLHSEQNAAEAPRSFYIQATLRF